MNESMTGTFLEKSTIYEIMDLYTEALQKSLLFYQAQMSGTWF